MTEMGKLAALLTDSNLPFEVVNFEIGGESTPQIIAPNKEDFHIDAVCHRGSYGHERGLLEVMAHDDYASITDYDVCGYLTAEEAFELFNNWWKIYAVKEQPEGKDEY